MSLVLRKLSKSTASALWIGWDPVPCDGYLFYVGGQRVSKSFDPNKHEIKFHPSAEQQGVRVDAIYFAQAATDSWPDAVPTYKRVAPRVAYAAGGSDARYCLKDFPGLRDDVASYDANGLCNGGRSNGSDKDCYTSAKEINGREYCDLPTQGDPTKNTGSWLI